MSACAQLARPLRLPTGHQLGVAARPRQDGRRHEIVVQDGVGLLQELGGAQGQEIGIARAGADDMGDARGRHVAARGIELAQRGAARAGIVARQRQARRRSLDQAAEEGAAPGRLGDQGVDLGAEGGGETRHGAQALGQRRFDAAAQDGGQGGRGAAGRDGDHDIVAIDDGGQDEIAQRRPVGHVHRHAGRPGGALRGGITVGIAGGDEGGGGAAEIRGLDGRRDDALDLGPGGAREVGPAIGGSALAHHHDATADKIEEQRQVLHETATRSSRLKASMAAAWEIDSTHRTASGLRRSLDMRTPALVGFLIWRVFAHPP